MRDGWSLPQIPDWGFESEPTPDGGTKKLRRGRVVGGTSWLTRFAVRGAAADFDGWSARGITGWSFADVLPIFRRIESDAEFGGRPWHGDAGPLPITRYPELDVSDIHAAALRAMEGVGFPPSKTTTHPTRSGSAGCRSARDGRTGHDGRRLPAAGPGEPNGPCRHARRERRDRRRASNRCPTRRRDRDPRSSGRARCRDLRESAAPAAVRYRSGATPARAWHPGRRRPARRRARTLPTIRRSRSTAVGRAPVSTDRSSTRSGRSKSRPRDDGRCPRHDDLGRRPRRRRADIRARVGADEAALERLGAAAVLRPDRDSSDHPSGSDAMSVTSIDWSRDIACSSN